jgi:hypothetical protein
MEQYGLVCSFTYVKFHTEISVWHTELSMVDSLRGYWAYEGYILSILYSILLLLLKIYIYITPYRAGSCEKEVLRRAVW